MSASISRPLDAASLPAWKVQDAKARFSALVREARQRGPQIVTVHGKNAVVVLSAEDFASLSGIAERPSLHELFSQSPFAELEFEPAGIASPVRDVIL